MTTTNKIVFITSLERSGSTLLDITLGRHPDLVSFGEVARVLLPHGGGGMPSVVDRPCSCGSKVADCKFWGAVTQEISKRESSLTLQDRYRIFLDHFHGMYGASKIPVDSSKFLKALGALVAQKQEGLDIRVLFTIRDVRGWSSSSKRADKRKREIPYSRVFSRDIIQWWKPYLRHNVLRHLPFWLPLEWFLRNSIIGRFIRQNNISAHHLSYEMLALDTDKTLSNLHSYIGVEPGLHIDKPQTHIVRGNRMAFGHSKISKIKYDHQWLKEVWTQYEAMAWPFVMTKNRDWVYGQRDE
jgi:hypothetical protein